MTKGRLPKIRTYVGLADRTHEATWIELKDFIDATIDANLDLSPGTLPVTHARCAAELKKVIDHVCRSYPTFFPKDQAGENYGHLQQYLIPRANKLKTENQSTLTGAGKVVQHAAASFDALPDPTIIETQVTSAGRPIRKSKVKAVKTLHQRLGISKSTPYARVIGRSVRALSEVVVVEDPSAVSQAGPTTGPSIDFSPTPIPITFSGPPPLPNADIKGPVENGLRTWLASCQPSLLHLHRYLVAFGCHDLQHIEAMAQSSSKEITHIVEAMKAETEELVLSGSVQPSSMDWHMLRLAIKNMRED
ncbi:hypothetical protein BDN72DRAFT_903564 [Pluteus cervinus]|uniref:Uncharacterized protein n=1 Tax=Pluteus cervinus TaxID=181527 RepID=A0ACD3A928_9AGAR|nr:hypothetical protein BDN72DRAFT_903564 [Pluteus cervinus]